MKKIALLFVLSLFVFQQSGFAYRSTGTYVAPSHSSTPNKSKTDNWSAKGNTNLFTGKKGYKQPY